MQQANTLRDEPEDMKFDNTVDLIRPIMQNDIKEDQHWVTLKDASTLNKSHTYLETNQQLTTSIHPVVRGGRGHVE